MGCSQSSDGGAVPGGIPNGGQPPASAAFDYTDPSLGAGGGMSSETSAQQQRAAAGGEAAPTLPQATDAALTGSGRHDSACLNPSVEALQTIGHKTSGTSGTKTSSATDVVSIKGDAGPVMVREASAHHLRNVFAKPLDMLRSQSIGTMATKEYPKTDAEKELIEKALENNFLFAEMKETQLIPLVIGLEPCTADKDDILIRQGDKGDYFYVLSQGSVEFLVNDNVVGSAEAGESGVSFGELALLYEAPRAATVKATTTCQLFRVHQTTFRTILKRESMEAERKKIALLERVPFIKDLAPSELAKLAQVMRPRQFNEGDELIDHRVADGSATDFWILKEGKVLKKYIAPEESKEGTESVPEDITYSSGESLGGSAKKDSKRAYIATALSDGMAFCIDKETFDTVLGDLDALLLRSADRTRLANIKIIKDTQLEPPIIGSLVNFMVERKYRKGYRICREGETEEAALYFVRSGAVQIVHKSKDDEMIPPNGVFGEDQLLADVVRGKNGPYDPTTTKIRYNAVAKEDTICGVLTLAVCRKCVDTTMLGKPHASVLDSLVTRQMPVAELKKHAILGAGTFGQVWLVSRLTSKGQTRAYALKIQCKQELLEAGQAKAVVNEKQIMAQLQSPFIINLVTTYKDRNFLYMLMQLVQGGELYSIMHSAGRHGLPEPQAKFCAAGIAEALGYMHRRGFVYRDLKPENVLIDQTGYPVIVDFGFAKYVPHFTYTLCGTPLYLAPEVLANRGHNQAADHWSYGVLVYEMICGRTPFYRAGMDQTDLFKAIIRGFFFVPDRASNEACNLMRKLLVKDPALRLGSLRGGEEDIIRHAFFSGLEMDQYRKKEIPAPLIPEVKNIFDTDNFEDWSHLEDKTSKKYPPLSRKDEEIFEKF